MAGRAEAGAVRVRLSMDTADFDKGVNTAESGLSKLSGSLGLTAKNAKIAGAAIAAAFVAVGAGLAVSISRVLEEMDKISKASQSFGIPVENLSALAHAANLSDVSVEALGKGVKKLSMNMAEIASGDAKGAAARSLDALGISVTNASGQLKTADQVMSEIATKFSTLNDGAGKTALAMNIFGKSGADLIPMLNEGAAGIAKAKDEAVALGIAFDTKTAKAAEQFNDNMTRIGQAFNGFVTKLTASVLPALVELSNKFVDFIKSSGIIDGAVTLISTSFKKLASVIIGASALFKSLYDVASAAVNIIKLQWEALPYYFEVIMKSTVNKVAAGIESIVNFFVSGLASIGKAVDYFAGTNIGNQISDSMSINLGRLNTDEAVAKLDEIGAKTKANIGGAFTDVTTNMKGALSEVTTLWSAWAATMETTAAEAPKRDAPMIQSMANMAEAQRLANEKLREQNALIQEGVNLVAQDKTPQEIMADKAKALDAALAKNKISAEQFGLAMQKASMVSLNAYAGMASGIASNLATAFGNSKAFAIAAAIINTAESVTKTLATYGATPWGIAAAAAAAAAGAAQIATIRSTGKNSGGGGSSASSVSSAAASTSSASSSSSSQQQGVYITLQGERYGREQVRGLIEQINDAVADGAVLRVAA